MIVFNRFKPFGFQIGIVSKHFKKVIIAITIGRINTVDSLSKYTIGVGWNLKELDTFQIFKRW